MKQSIQFYGGLFAITLSTLMLEIVQTRILSVTTWYHLAFFAISIAMFGLTAGAVWVYLKGERFTEKTLSADLCYFSSAFAVATALSFLTQMTLCLVQNGSATFFVAWLELSLCMAVPFFFSGVVVSLALTRSPYRIGLVYAVDLAGAAVGCLGVLLILNLTDGPSAVLWTSAIAACGAAFFRHSNIGDAPPIKGWLYRPLPIAVILATVAAVNGMTWHGFQPLFIKQQAVNHRGDPLFYEKWNTFSRVAVFDRKYPEAPLLWGKSSKLPPDLKINQYFFNIDGAAGTTMPFFSGDLKDIEFLQYDVTNLAYSIRNRGKSAVIGVGGGRDVLSARYFGFEEITGVEINPIFIDLLTNHKTFTDANKIATLPGVHFVVDEARSWFSRTQERFDLIQISMIDTWATTSAGAFTLSENGIYTVEAFKTFMDKLSDNGVLTVSRWYAPGEINETGRLISLAVAVLTEQGAIEPQRHIFLASTNNVATLILSRHQLLPADVLSLKQKVRENGFKTVISPSDSPASDVLERILTAKSRRELEAYTSSQVLDLTPPTDNKPFFFNQLPLNKPISSLKLALNAQYNGVIAGNIKATVTLLTTLLISLSLVLVVLVYPLRRAVRQTSMRLAAGGTLYFSMLGVGFMFAEMGLIQRLSVFLGHPTYSLSVVLFSLILSTGLGSFLSDRIALNEKKRFCLWAALICATILVLPFLLSFICGRYQSSGALIRILLSITLIAPMGVLMGFGFPTGMLLAESVDKKPTPWFWGINGATGVLASGLTVAASITFGIGASFLVAAICYGSLIPAAIVIGFPSKKEIS